MFDISNNKWLDVTGDLILLHEEAAGFDRCVFNVGEVKHRVLLPNDDESERPLMSWFNDIAFQYTIARHRSELYVVKRLADGQLYLDSHRRWEESNIRTSNPGMFVHYEIPAMRGEYENRVYALIDTQLLNSRIAMSQTAKFGYATIIDFVVSNLSANDIPRLMSVLGIPYNRFSRAMVSDDDDHVAATKSIFADWYVVVRSVGAASKAPLNLLAWGLNELKMYELVKMLRPDGLSQNETCEKIANIVGDIYDKRDESDNSESETD